MNNRLEIKRNIHPSEHELRPASGKGRGSGTSPTRICRKDEDGNRRKSYPHPISRPVTLLPLYTTVETFTKGVRLFPRLLSS